MDAQRILHFTPSVRLTGGSAEQRAEHIRYRIRRDEAVGQVVSLDLKLELQLLPNREVLGERHIQAPHPRTDEAVDEPGILTFGVRRQLAELGGVEPALAGAVSSVGSPPSKTAGKLRKLSGVPEFNMKSQLVDQPPTNRVCDGTHRVHKRAPFAEWQVVRARAGKPVAGKTRVLVCEAA